MNLHDLVPRPATELTIGAHVKLIAREPFMQAVWGATGRVIEQIDGWTNMWRVTPDTPIPQLRAGYIAVYPYEVEIIP